MDLGSMTNREAVLLQQLGIPSVAALGRRLQPSGEDKVMDYAAWDAFVWLALRRAGIEVDVHTFEYDVFSIRITTDEKPEPLPGPDDPGKARAPEALTRSPRKRSTPSPTSRRRSTPTA
jgi:hypothetical protein